MSGFIQIKKVRTDIVFSLSGKVMGSVGLGYLDFDRSHRKVQKFVSATRIL